MPDLIKSEASVDLLTNLKVHMTLLTYLENHLNAMPNLVTPTDLAMNLEACIKLLNQFEISYDPTEKT